MKLSRQEIMQQMEQFKEGEVLKFKIPEIFGGGVTLISLNPNYPKDGGKKYFLRLGNDEKLAEQSEPYWPTDKAKDLAKWVADRQGDKMD